MDRVCVYCASSRSCPPHHHESAAELGRLLAEAGKTLVYGGGGAGSMGAIANGALEAGGRVIGVIPEFMRELEWGHDGVELEVVPDMHTRKARMIELADGLVALPGGTGTFEELLEAITWKRLALTHVPIVIGNFGGYYDPLLALFERAGSERFVDPRHLGMWGVARTPAEVLQVLEDTPPWHEDAQSFAVP